MILTERFNGIRAFVQAEQSGSFAAASAVLGLSQSAVSKAIARLEERLGVRLFHRTTRNLTLTDEGRIYLESCRSALDELGAAEAALSARKDIPVGRVRINLPDLFGRKCVAPALMRLALQYPRLHFDVSFENRIINLVEDGYDLAVRIGHLRDSSDLISKRIGQQDVIVCASADYLKAHGMPVTMVDLDQHHCITQLRGGRPEPWIFINERGEEVRCAVPSGHSFGTSDMIAEAAIASLGLAQLPYWLVEDRLSSNELVQIVMDVRMPTLPIHIVWPAGRIMASRVRITIDEIARSSAWVRAFV